MNYYIAPFSATLNSSLSLSQDLKRQSLDLKRQSLDLWKVWKPRLATALGVTYHTIIVASMATYWVLQALFTLLQLWVDLTVEESIKMEDDQIEVEQRLSDDKQRTTCVWTGLEAFTIKQLRTAFPDVASMVPSSAKKAVLIQTILDTVGY